MSMRNAVRTMVREYPGGGSGVEQLALVVGKSPSTLDKELRGSAGFKLGVDDAEEITVHCHDLGMPQARQMVTALAARIDCMVLPMPCGTEHGDDECLRAVADASREMHELMTETMQALADGRISDNERTRLERQAAELVRAVQGLLQLLAARNEASKPSYERRTQRGGDA